VINHSSLKSVVKITHGQTIICSKRIWTLLRMSRPLFAGSFYRSRGGISANEKGEKMHPMPKSVVCLPMLFQTLRGKITFRNNGSSK